MANAKLNPNAGPQVAARAFGGDPEVLRAVRAASALSGFRSALAIAGDWAIVAGAVWAASASSNFFIYVAAVVAIATRQHALLTLAHEAVHKRLFSNAAVNDLVGDWLCGFPSGLAIGWYRANHLAHHRHVNGDQDPDWVRKVGRPEWTFPCSPRRLAKTFAILLVKGGAEWLTLMTLLASAGAKGGRAGKARAVAYRSLFWLGVGAAVAATGTWREFLLLWVVPLTVVFPLIFRIRSIAEHFALAREHDLNDSRNVLAGPIERFLFAPHNVNYHLLHHLFPSVPQHSLPALHRELMKHDAYAELGAHNRAYAWPYRGSVLEDLLGTRAVAGAAHAAEPRRPEAA